MAIQDKGLSPAEHDWYATRSGAPSNAPLSQHKFNYYASKSIPKAPLWQMERQWLQSLTGVVGKNEGDIWREAVAGQGLTPSVSTSENKFIFFTQVTTDP